MNAREILDPLRQNERASRERGVTHAALFGCAARGEPRSDIDITVEIAPDVRVGVIAFAGIVQLIEDMFPTGGATTRRCFSIREQGRPILASARSGIFQCSAPRGNTQMASGRPTRRERADNCGLSELSS
jgi:predicted nucleotidyltransferase